MLRLQVPAGLEPPAVMVQARGGAYQMTPLRMSNPSEGWRVFEWGAGLIQRESISPSQLRAYLAGVISSLVLALVKGE